MGRAKVLIVGIGNPGRGDDGLGPALIERLAGIEKGTLAEGEVGEDPGRGLAWVWKYQLNIEDALLVRDFDLVVFVDASTVSAGPAELERIVPGASIAFTTHEMSPASVLALVEELYNRSPEAYLLPVPGAAWDLVEGLSAEGSAALELAVQQLETFLEDRTKSRGALG